MKPSQPQQPFALMQQVESFCRDHQIQPIPLNYVVSYEHLSHNHPELTQDIEQQLEQGHSLNHSLMEQLHQTHLVPDREQLLQNSGQMQQIIDNLIQSIEQSSTSVDTLTEALDQGMSELANQPVQPELKNLVAQLLDASLRARQDQSRLHEQLQQTEAEAAQLQQQLNQARQQAQTDSLTGLLNRDGLQQQLDRLLQHEPHQISLVALDIDHFKRFNDSYGHLLGDKVLQAVAQQIQAEIGDSGLAVRYGGEELLLVLPEHSQAQTLKLAESIRTKVQRIKLINKRTGQSIPSVTLSAGVAQKRPQEPWDDWLDRADQALYQAKDEGRNRVVSAAR